MFAAALNQQLRIVDNKSYRKNKSIRVIGKLDSDGSPIFQSTQTHRKIPKTCYMKNVLNEVVFLKDANVRKYADMITREPSLMAGAYTVRDLPILIDNKEVVSQMGEYRVSVDAQRSVKSIQQASWGAFISTFHRDTMFSRKVHTLSPGSMKLWCFERDIGEVNLDSLEDAESQMRLVTGNPLGYDFFLQEPGDIIEHDGGYAHFVMTFNRRSSPYDQWSILVGWEINTAGQIHHGMLVDEPLLQGSDGNLVLVSEQAYLSACARSTRLSSTLMQSQVDNHAQFLQRQQENSLKKVYKTAKVAKDKASRYSGLNHKKPAPSLD